jgi:hypothetical protein
MKPCEPVDAIDRPSHYAHFPFEAIELIKTVLNSDLCARLTPYECYCVGSALKYRLRAGLKGDPAQDIGKALKFMELFDE